MAEVIVEWGRRLPNGNEDWQSEEGGFQPPWSTPEGRAAAQDFYDEEVRRCGIVPSEATKLVFLRRERRVEYTTAEVVVDDVDPID